MSTKDYPRTETFGKNRLTFRMMTASDEKLLLRFANTLPESDLIFLRMDITQPEVVSEWITNLRQGRTTTILVEEANTVVGYVSLHKSNLSWTRHIGEIRVMVAPSLRGLGIGRLLVKQAITLAAEAGLERVIVQIPANQPRVRHMFEELDFDPAAFLTDWLKDRNNKTHDLIIMSEEVGSSK